MIIGEQRTTLFRKAVSFGIFYFLGIERRRQTSDMYSTYNYNKIKHSSQPNMDAKLALNDDSAIIFQQTQLRWVFLCNITWSWSPDMQISQNALIYQLCYILQTF